MINGGSMESNDIINFLSHHLSEIHGFLYMVWDNIAIHKSRIVNDFLETNNNRLITRRIPAYSPKLNPDEFVLNDLNTRNFQISVQQI